MELAQDWRLYLSLTRGKKARSARVAAASGAGSDGAQVAVTAVISGANTQDAEARVLEVRTETGELQEFLGCPLRELRAHLGGARELCVISSADLRASFQMASQSNSLFEQRRIFRDALNRLNPAGKNRVGIPRSKEQNHFLLSAFSSGGLSRLFPKNFILWIRFQESAASTKGQVVRDDLIGLREGEVVGCGVADLSSLGPDRITNLEWVAKHLSEKYVLPVQGLVVQQSA